MTDSDELLFADADPALAQPASEAAWKVLIVDDEEQIHAVTKMVLSDFRFRDKPLAFLSAFSGAQGREVLRDQPDVAVVFLDVVMETEHAGLDLAKEIREGLGNRFVRIILRTGQPGQAPERRVIVDYDINDYKEKSELTSQKLFSSMVTALRSYQDIMTIETSRRVLENIISTAGLGRDIIDAK
jgi:CheY-like chemotaxis protein